MGKSQIQIKLKSFNHQLLGFSCKKIISILSDITFKSLGVVSLPTKKRIYCVLRSPHVDNDSREHFEIRIHKRLIKIICDSENNCDLETEKIGKKIVDLLFEANLPSGVYYKCTIG
ncbi:MAG: 30S ribosomal protein S10 [Okeania sp. SIO2H7]|nr:30S ribosomal protein S10 [Okeania sp. SIO2H7]